MQEFIGHLKPPDRRTGLILLLAAVLPVLYVYNGSPEFYLGTVAPLLGLDTHPLAEMHAQFYRFGAIFLLFGVIPVVLGFALLGEGPSRFGFVAGDWRLGLKVVAMALLVSAPFLYLSAGQGDFQAEYPMSKLAAADPLRFTLYEGAYLFYYIGWETLFRGYMLFGLKDRYGSFGAILFQCFPSILIHIGKPSGEIWGSVVAGLLLGAVALRTRSVFYGFVFHYAIGVLMDVFCALRGGLLGG
ncbi:MAG: CPBP family intramembrane metalloprotease [Deltaproteobacteria bacterium]|nr:CPBP family intramembrane metalloprotease [Deltaproteobacteria bacterium]